MTSKNIFHVEWNHTIVRSNIKTYAGLENWPFGHDGQIFGFIAGSDYRTYARKFARTDVSWSLTSDPANYLMKVQTSGKLETSFSFPYVKPTKELTNAYNEFMKAKNADDSDDTWETAEILLDHKTSLDGYTVRCLASQFYSLTKDAKGTQRQTDIIKIRALDNFTGYTYYFPIKPVLDLLKLYKTAVLTIRLILDETAKPTLELTINDGIRVTHRVYGTHDVKQTGNVYELTPGIIPTLTSLANAIVDALASLATACRTPQNCPETAVSPEPDAVAAETASDDLVTEFFATVTTDQPKKRRPRKRNRKPVTTRQKPRQTCLSGRRRTPVYDDVFAACSYVLSR